VNVFVESNLVLELALAQQEAPSCRKLVSLARTKAIRLFLPSYSFVEPHETLTRRKLDRESLRSQLSKELTQLARSEQLAERASASRETVKLLFESSEYEAIQIEKVKQRLWSVSEVLSLDVKVLRTAAECQADYNLSAQDAIVYASIRTQLKLEHAAVSCFISRNPSRL
jgi:predicted nucleic acid-binding protein